MKRGLSNEESGPSNIVGVEQFKKGGQPFSPVCP